jgi:hypothetical protein
MSKLIAQKMTNIVNDILFKISSKNIDIINLEDYDSKLNSESSVLSKKIITLIINSQFIIQECSYRYENNEKIKIKTYIL